MEKDVPLTRDGYEKLKQTLEELETVKRREVADRIREAREFGDISENSEYDDAKNEQALLESRILRLKEQLRSARVVDTSDVSTDPSGATTISTTRASRSAPSFRDVRSVESRSGNMEKIRAAV